MPIDLFEFWTQIGPDEFIHPADRAVFCRLGSEGHGFKLETLPVCFMGPLRDAPVVLLFMSPGFTQDDEDRASLPTEQDRYVRTRAGNEPLPELGIPGGKWWRERVKCFKVDPLIAAKKIAILNIGAYHSKEMHDSELLAALPSSRVSLDWAQEVLFPQAISGSRVVVCLRSAKFWGLNEGKRYGAGLFAPEVTRGGHMHHGPLRMEIIEAVAARLGRPKAA